MEIYRKIPRMETIKNTAKILGLTEGFVRHKVLAGEVVSVKAGNRYLVNIDKFIDYLNGKPIFPPKEQKGGDLIE